MRRLRGGFSTISVFGTFRVTKALLVNEPYVVCGKDSQFQCPFQSRSQNILFSNRKRPRENILGDNRRTRPHSGQSPSHRGRGRMGE